jgi:hypothetical protein
MPWLGNVSQRVLYWEHRQSSLAGLDYQAVQLGWRATEPARAIAYVVGVKDEPCVPLRGLTDKPQASFDIRTNAI